MQLVSEVGPAPPGGGSWRRRRHKVGLAVAIVDLLDAAPGLWAPVDIGKVLGVTTHQAAARCGELLRRDLIDRPQRGLYTSKQVR